jgi:hypothetical protein
MTTTRSWPPRPVVLLAVAASLFIAVWVAAECDCAYASNKQSFKCHRAVFVGTVVSGDGYFAPASVHVEETFKGTLPKTVNVSSGGGCGFSLAEGQTYLLETFEGEDGLTLKTSVCSHTRPVEDPRAVQAIAELRRRAWWWRLPFSGFCR